MLHMNDIPDLVIYHIIKQMCSEYKDVRDFRYRLPLIAVNRKFRRAGSSLVYDYLFIVTTTKFIYQDTETHTKMDVFSNIHFYQIVERCTFVKRIGLDSQFPSSISKGSLDPVVKPIADIVARYSPIPVSNEDLVANPSLVVEKFLGMFPNIINVDLDADSEETKAREFATLWANILDNQLVEFHSTIPLAGMVTQSFLELTAVTFSCDISSSIPLLRVNPLPLQSLHIIDPPKDFTWQCFQPNNGVLEFPNLTTLSLSCLKIGRHRDVAMEDIRRIDTAPGNLRLQFPKLRVLKVNEDNDIGIVFRPEIIPSHLEEFRMTIYDREFLNFGQLPIESVDCLDIYVGQRYEMWDGAFYDISNRLFGEVRITMEARVQLDFDYTDIVDVERIHWTNVSILSITIRELECCVSYLDKIPCLKILELSFWNRSAEYGEEEEEGELIKALPTEPIAKLKGHRLKVLTVRNNFDDLLSKYDVAMSVCLVKSLKNLKTLVLPNGENEDIVKAIKDTAQNYPHINNIQINYNY